uniref:Si:ch73-335m24.2 n=1 Tax=Poecilia latipinna TaxID=48699 RepID=A0A3B3VVD4_9TELE
FLFFFLLVNPGHGFPANDNHTAHACEGDLLVIKCPSRTSVAVLSAFYGRRVPNKHLCPAPNANITVEEEDTDCTSSTALENARCFPRSCHIPVLAPVFGPDPCPLTTKYLLVKHGCHRWSIAYGFEVVIRPQPAH